jgi:hypothetical protein
VECLPFDPLVQGSGFSAALHQRSKANQEVCL